MQIWWSNPYKMWFLEGRLPKYFFQEMCSSGGKQTVHKVSAAFIVKNCHPRTSLKIELLTINMNITKNFLYFRFFFGRVNNKWFHSNLSV